MTITAATTISSLASAPSRPAERTEPARPDASFGATLARVEAQSTPVPIHGKGGQSGELGELQQFEGFVLRMFMESMLPQDNSSFFGTGTAGGIWRSMMAERLGEEMAAAGGVGIADLLRETGTRAANAAQASDELASTADAHLGAAASATRAP